MKTVKIARLVLAIAMLCGRNTIAIADESVRSGPSAIDIPFEVHSGHIYIHVEIDGKGPLLFVFDTGALNVLAPATAAQLGLSVSGDVEATGFGGVQQGGSTEVASVRIGDATMRDQTFYVIDLPSVANEGRRIDGLIGYEWLRRFPTRIDYTKSVITFYSVGRLSYTGTAAPTPLHFRGRRALVDGMVDGIAGRFTIDTGARNSLLLYPYFVDKYGLNIRYQPKTEVMSSIGVGGPAYGLLTRADRLDVAGATIVRPVTYLLQPRPNASSADRETAGNIGYGILRRFDITFDYGSEVAYFEPNAGFGQPDLADRSGLRVALAPNGFKVVFVAKDSAGMRAGLQVDDIILSVDGKPARDDELDPFREQLKGAVGTRIALTLTRDDTSTVVTLADLE